MTHPSDVERGALNWTVAQLGAREHYAVPRAFHGRGRLRRLYTDAWCRYGTTILHRGPQRLRALTSRFHPAIPADKVVSFTLSTLAREAKVAMRRSDRSVGALYAHFIEEGAAFAERVARSLSRCPLDPARDAFFGFKSTSLEALHWAQGRGMLSIVDQTDAGRVHEDLLLKEIAAWPGWQDMPGRIPEEYYDRCRREWDVASLILVNSDWARRAVIAQGGPADKIIVVPLAYESPAAAPPEREDQMSGRPLTVLFLGSVNLMKGIQYLVGAARALTNSSVRVVVAGPLGISRDAVASAPENISFIGRVTRDRAADVYRSADVFVFPTLSDGFGLTQLEAMSHGLPVITTPNCGDVVTPEVDGLIIPAADTAALAAAIARLDGDRRLLSAMSRNAVAKSRQFTLERYAATIESAVDSRRAVTGSAAVR